MQNKRGLAKKQRGLFTKATGDKATTPKVGDPIFKAKQRGLVLEGEFIPLVDVAIQVVSNAMECFTNRS